MKYSVIITCLFTLSISTAVAAMSASDLKKNFNEAKAKSKTTININQTDILKQNQIKARLINSMSFNSYNPNDFKFYFKKESITYVDSHFNRITKYVPIGYMISDKIICKYDESLPHYGGELIGCYER